MKILNLTDYCRRYYELIRLEYAKKPSYDELSWFEFKVRHFDLYLREMGVDFRFRHQCDALNNKWICYDPDLTQEKLIAEIDLEINNYNKNRKWRYQLLNRLKSILLKQRKYAV